MAAPAAQRHSNDLSLQCVNTFRFLSVDAVQKANSGHPGLPMGAAAMAKVLWTQFLRHNPANPYWFDRDRFVLSPGHGSMLLYSLLHLSGYDLLLDQIKRFRQWGSITPGHPECGTTPGVEVTTGHLAKALPMASEWRWLRRTWQRGSIGPALISLIISPTALSAMAI